jgi:hypothetical protein
MMGTGQMGMVIKGEVEDSDGLGRRCRVRMLAAGDMDQGKCVQVGGFRVPDLLSPRLSLNGDGVDVDGSDSSLSDQGWIRQGGDGLNGMVGRSKGRRWIGRIVWLTIVGLRVVVRLAKIKRKIKFGRRLRVSMPFVNYTLAVYAACLLCTKALSPYALASRVY